MSGRGAEPEPGRTEDRVERAREVRAPLFRGLPKTVWAAVVLWVCLLLTWSLVLPMYRAPDEVHHVSAILHLEHHQTWPGFKELPRDQGAFTAQEAFGVVSLDFSPYGPLRAAEAIPRGDRPSYAEMGAGSHGLGRSLSGQHPPGYYAALAVGTWLLPDSTPADLEAWLLRLASVVLLAPLPVVLAAATRRLGGPPTVVMVAAVLPFTVPQLAMMGGAVNNDNLLNAMAAWMALGAVLVLTGDLRVRTGALIGLATGIALVAKAFALVFVPVIAAAYLVAGRRAGRWRQAAVGLGAFAVAAASGGWWWIHNLVRYGQLQPSGHVPPRESGRLSFAESIGDYLVVFVERVPSRFWAAFWTYGLARPGDPGATPFSLSFTGVLSVLLIGLLLAALLRRATYDATRADVAVLLAPFGLILIVLSVSTWNIYARTGTPSGLQGRYLFAALPGVFVVVALLLGRWFAHRLHPMLLPSAVAGLGLLFATVSLDRAATFHWGVDHTSRNGVLGAVEAWSPLPTALNALIALGVVVSVMAVAACLAADRNRLSDGAAGTQTILDSSVQ